MSGTEDVVVGAEAAVAEVAVMEGDPGWRPWSGGHESPLEALWQWMCAKGVGGLTAPEPLGLPAGDAGPANASYASERAAASEPVTGFAAVDAAAQAEPSSEQDG